METQIRIINVVESKSPGYAKANTPHTIGDGNAAVGLSIVHLLNDGEFKGKCVGKQGAMRKKIAKVCESALEYPGNDAYIVGDGPQRARTAALLNIVQTQSGGETGAVPKELEDSCTRIVITDAQSRAVMGTGRVNMNYVEEETSTVSFWVPTESKEEEAEKPDFTPAVGDIYDARFVDKVKGDKWFDAKVVEIIKGDDGVKYKMEWQYDPDEEKSVVSISDLRKVGTAPTKQAPVDRTLGIFGPEAKREAAVLMVKDLMAGKDIWPKKQEESSWAEEPEAKKPRVEYVVEDVEVERRRKRAARFGNV